MSRNQNPARQFSESFDSEDLGMYTPPSSGYYTSASRPIVPDPGDYRALLRKVVDAARRALFPSRGSYDMSAVQAAPSEAEANDRPYYERSASQLERDKGVGAAGELFVSILTIPPF